MISLKCRDLATQWLACLSSAIGMAGPFGAHFRLGRSSSEILHQGECLLVPTILPRHKTNTCRKKNLGEFKFCAKCMRGLYLQSREYRKVLLRDRFRILAKFLMNSYRCKYMSRLYSHLREYRKNSWRIIYILVSCQGVPFATKNITYPPTGTEFGERDATKQKSAKNNAFSLNEGEAFSEWRPGKEREKGPTQTFGEDLGQKGVPNGPFWAIKCLVSVSLVLALVSSFVWAPYSLYRHWGQRGSPQTLRENAETWTPTVVNRR